MFKKFIFIITLLSLYVSIPLLGVGAEEDPNSTYKEFNYFDTITKINIKGVDSVPLDHWTQIENLMIQIQNTFSRTDVTSELHRLNLSAGIEPFITSDDLYFLIKMSVEYADLTDGKFEPTIGPLIELWGELGEIDHAPTLVEIQALKPLIDYKLIQFDDDNQTIYLPKKGMKIDLGAIAKGYAGDLIKELVVSLDYKHATINLGGNLLTVGTREETNTYGTNDWAIGLDNPNYRYFNKDDEERLIGIFLITDKTIVSSGTYERQWFDLSTGIKYHHILDPETGFSVDNNIEMVTIITNNSAEADALSTSLFALGIEDGMALVDSLNNVDAVFVTYDRELYFSSGFGENVKFRHTNSSFIINELDQDKVIVDIEEDETNFTVKNILIASGVIFVITLGGLGFKKFIV